MTGHTDNLVGDAISNILSLTEPGTQVSLGSHSLGTNLAVKALEKHPDIKRQISKTYLFNPPYNIFGKGANRQFENDPAVRYFFNSKDLVSLTRTGKPPTNAVVKTSDESILDVLDNHEVTQWGGTPPTKAQLHAQEVLREQYGVDENPRNITPANYPQFAYDKDDNVVTHDDPSLHVDNKIPPHYSAVTTHGVLHMMYQPSETVPKFTNHTKTIISGAKAH